MKKTCRAVLGILAALYLIALAIGLVGTFGWFGQDEDPLSWVFVVLLGQPWAQWVDVLPETLRLWASAMAPALNILLVSLLCRLLPRPRA